MYFSVYIYVYLCYCICVFVGQVERGSKKGGVDLSSGRSPQINIKSTLHLCFSSRYIFVSILSILYLAI